MEPDVHSTAIGQLLVQYRHTQLYRMFLLYCCCLDQALNTEDTLHNAIAFLCETFRRVLVIEAHQERFIGRWRTILGNLQVKEEALQALLTNGRNLHLPGLVVLYTSPEYHRLGFFLYRYDEAVMSIMHLYLGFDGAGGYEPRWPPDLFTMYSILDLPSSLARPVILHGDDRDPVRCFIRMNMLRQDSPDGIFWRLDARLLCDAESAFNLLYYDERIIESFACSRSLAWSVGAAVPKHASADLDRLIAASYIYLMYGLLMYLSSFS